MINYANEVFAAIDHDHVLERIAGGNETEVYRTDDQRYVVKLKCDLGNTLLSALAHARAMRDAAERYTDCLGPRHTIPSHYIVARDTDGRIQVLVIQEFLAGAQPLFALDYAGMGAEDRAHIATELRDIIRRSLDFFRTTGSMPDLYGRTSASSHERAQQKRLAQLPRRVWSFVAQRNLLRSHNLMRTAETPARIVLVDYDFVRRSQLYRLVYFTVRWMLFWRDHMLIMLMRESGKTPPQSH